VEARDWQVPGIRVRRTRAAARDAAASAGKMPALRLAAWYYPEPKDAAREIRDRIAFWKGVEVR